MSQNNKTWQKHLADAVRDPAELRRIVGLADDAYCDKYTFGTLVPRNFIGLMRRGDPRDPLLLQVMPAPAENEPHDGFVADPLGESASIPFRTGHTPCLLQKYQGRSLIITTAACGVHCRYCFRRHYTHCNGIAAGNPIDRLEPALAQISADQSLREVILSGGDPLTLDDLQLAELVERLAKIPHLRRLRVHTRMPIVIHLRVTPGLIDLLKSTRLTAAVVVQINHPQEISDDVSSALAAFIDAGVPVFCQSVLLAGVNDNLEILASLYERLIDIRVMPYYLHQLDRVAGAAHFEVPDSLGRELIAGLRDLLPGYGVPRYVREVPGARHKRSLA